MLAAALLTAAAALHARGVLHRDLKPENVFRIETAGPGLHATLIDFGLALHASTPDGERSWPTRAPGRRNTCRPSRSPARTPTRAADVYALGVMLFELFTLRPPFVGDRRELEYAHLSYRPPPALALRARRRRRWRSWSSAAWPRTRPTASPTRSPLQAAFERGGRRSGRDRAEPGRGRAGRRPSAAAPLGGRARVRRRRCSSCSLRRAWRPPTSRRALAPSAASWRTSRPAAVSAPSPTGPGITRDSAPTPPPQVLMAHGLAAAAHRRRRHHRRAPAPRRPRPAVQPDVLAGRALPRRRAIPWASSSPPPRATSCRPCPARRSPGRPQHYLPVGRPDDERTRLDRAPAARPACRCSGATRTLRRCWPRPCGALAERRPRVASVLAEPGLGKTRLGARACPAAAQPSCPGAEVIELLAREPLGNDADEALADLLRRALDLPAVPAGEDGRALLLERLGEERRRGGHRRRPAAGLDPGRAPGRAVLAGRPRRAAGQRRPGRRDGPAAPGRPTGPVLVLLDDAHWADDTLLDTLEQATVSRLPLWVCALGRPAFADSRPTWGAARGRRPHRAAGTARPGQRRRAVPPPARAGGPGARDGHGPPGRSRPVDPAAARAI